jgi:hypothetical protein
MMKTGFGESSGLYEEAQANALIGILTPVLEQSMVLASQYAKACGRDTVLGKDMEYAIKYCAMHTVGRNTGSLFPEIYDEDSSDEDDILEDVDESECPPFEPYTGEDPIFQKMNESYENWYSWVPQSPVEEMLKNAINSNGHI